MTSSLHQQEEMNDTKVANLELGESAMEENTASTRPLVKLHSGMKERALQRNERRVYRADGSECVAARDETDFRCHPNETSQQSLPDDDEEDESEELPAEKRTKATRRSSPCPVNLIPAPEDIDTSKKSNKKKNKKEKNKKAAPRRKKLELTRSSSLPDMREMIRECEEENKKAAVVASEPKTIPKKSFHESFSNLPKPKQRSRSNASKSRRKPRKAEQPERKSTKKNSPQQQTIATKADPEDEPTNNTASTCDSSSNSEEYWQSLFENSELVPNENPATTTTTPAAKQEAPQSSPSKPMATTTTTVTTVTVVTTITTTTTILTKINEQGECVVEALPPVVETSVDRQEAKTTVTSGNATGVVEQTQVVLASSKQQRKSEQQAAKDKAPSAPLRAGSCAASFTDNSHHDLHSSSSSCSSSDIGTASGHSFFYDEMDDEDSSSSDDDEEGTEALSLFVCDFGSKKGPSSAKDSPQQQQEPQQQQASKNGNRRDLALQTYYRWGCPTRMRMKEQLKEAIGCDLTEAEVDQLPWTASGGRVNVIQYNAINNRGQPIVRKQRARLLRPSDAGETLIAEKV